MGLFPNGSKALVLEKGKYLFSKKQKLQTCKFPFVSWGLSRDKYRTQTYFFDRSREIPEF